MPGPELSKAFSDPLHNRNQSSTPTPKGMRILSSKRVEKLSRTQVTKDTSTASFKGSRKTEIQRLARKHASIPSSVFFFDHGRTTRPKYTPIRVEKESPKVSTSTEINAISRPKSRRERRAPKVNCKGPSPGRTIR